MKLSIRSCSLAIHLPGKAIIGFILGSGMTDVNQQLRRCVPKAFRDAIVQRVAQRTLEALASHHPDKKGKPLDGKRLAESLGIGEEILSRWKDGELSFPMLVQVLLVKEWDWTNLVFYTRELIMKAGEHERLNLAGLTSALQASYLALRGQPATVELSDRVVASLVLLWRWGPRDQRMNPQWVWNPQGEWQPPAGAAGNGAAVEQHEDDDSVREGRQEAAAHIKQYVGEEMVDATAKPGSKRGHSAQQVLEKWAADWGEVAIATFNIVQQSCVEPEPH